MTCWSSACCCIAAAKVSNILSLFAEVSPLNHFSHFTSFSPRSMPSFIPKLFYKVRSAGPNNNRKQSRHISCSHQSYFDQSLSPGSVPSSHQLLCHTLSMQAPGMLGNEGWQGASRRPITTHVGKKEKMSCEGVGTLHLHLRYLASAFIQTTGGMSFMHCKHCKQLCK